ncbi:MAG: AI-2E family transporter [Acidobacteriota bacterium]
MQAKGTRIGFLVLLGLLLVAFVAIIKPFLMPGLLAVLVVIICDPIYQILLRWLRQRRYIAALCATFLVLLVVIIPLGIVVGVVISNAANVVMNITTQLEGGQMAQQIDQATEWVKSKISIVAGLLPADFDLRSTVLGVFKSIGSVVYQYSPRVLSATIGLLGGLLLMIVFIFVLFAEGARLYQSILSLLPLDEEHKKVIVREIRFVISATFLSMIATSVAQGILIGIGFWIAGISNPFIWGLVAIGVTLIPVIGGPIMYVTAAAALLIGGRWVAAIFILIYGIGIVSTVDNIIKPLIMRGKVNVHPLLLALSIMGGGMWLGPIGIILGPLVVVLLLAMLKIYQREFS